MALALIVLAALLLAGTRRVARSLVYFPERDAGTPRPRGVEDVDFAAEDGTRLHAWLARTPGATRAVLFAHGNAGNVQQRGGLLVEVARAAAAHALMFDYRGYGRSEGKPHEAGVCADARGALEALERATGVSRSRTVFVGHSLGGAVAIDLASQREPAGLVVVSSFTSIGDMARFLYGFPPGFLCPETWASDRKIARIACPKLVVHGDQDATVPFALGERLFAAAAEPKAFVRVPGADHDPFEHVLEEIGRFVDACAGGGT